MKTLTVICPGCDGDGSLSAQWAKEQWLKNPGRMEATDGVGMRWVYYTPEGEEIGFKTIGGPYEICYGAKVVTVTDGMITTASPFSQG